MLTREVRITNINAGLVISKEKSMKAYKLEILAVDFDGLGEEGIKDAIENARYPNRCIYPTVMNADSREIEWSDDHPLNNIDTQRKCYEELFGKDKSEERSI